MPVSSHSGVSNPPASSHGHSGDALTRPRHAALTSKEKSNCNASHEQYQIRPQCGPRDGADAFKQYVLQVVRTHAVVTVAEEMSVEALRGRHTVGREVAKEAKLSHLFFDPTVSERKALGISRDDAFSGMLREGEWLRRLKDHSKYPVLFVCGANHVNSFARLCLNEKLTPTILNDDFEADILLECRII